MEARRARRLGSIGEINLLNSVNSVKKAGKKFSVWSFQVEVWSFQPRQRRGGEHGGNGVWGVAVFRFRSPI